ncbi:hypothetical protein JCM11641_001357 [Rhodosporidiobolus odoratus]
MRFVSALTAASTFSALFARVAALRQPYEYLAALQRFQDEWVNPAETVERGWSESLSDDCVGRVDLTTTFQGQELNTEYLFGLFQNVRSDPNTTHITGYPVAQEIQSLLVEPPLVYFSVILDLAFDTINQRIPVQLDVITAWNDDLKIISYDASFRRWPQSFEYISTQIAPQIAQELGESYDAVSTNKSALFARKAAKELCATARDHCVGSNKQYDSYDECYHFLTEERPWGNALDGGLDTTWCRYVHGNMVQFRPDIHCAHIGPSGGDMCIDRDYLEVTKAFPFSQTFVAPNVTWDDRDMAKLSKKSVDELAMLKLTLAFPTTVAFFSVPTFVFLCILYISAKIIETLFARFSFEYRLLTLANQRNTVTYLLNTIVTTIALGFQLVCTPSLLHVYTKIGVQCQTITAAMISALYIFEMIYRESMRPSLLAHHFCTLLAIISLFVAIENTYHPAIIGVGCIWLFQATTEQSVFISLLMYRLKFNSITTRTALRFAAVQSFLVKFIFAIYLLVEHSLKLVHFTEVGTDIYFSVIVYTVGTLLLLTQAYGSWAVWAISLKLTQQLRANKDGSCAGPSPAGQSIRGFVNLEDEVDDDIKGGLAPSTPTSASSVTSV